MPILSHTAFLQAPQARAVEAARAGHVHGRVGAEEDAALLKELQRLFPLFAPHRDAVRVNFEQGARAMCVRRDGKRGSSPPRCFPSTCLADVERREAKGGRVAVELAQVLKSMSIDRPIMEVCHGWKERRERGYAIVKNGPRGEGGGDKIENNVPPASRAPPCRRSSGSAS